MKIGILTAHAKYSYEMSLQAYALQEFLRKNGHEAEVIDYRPAVFDAWNESFRGNVKQKKENYEKFQSQFLHFSKTVRNRAEAEQLAGKYDLLITAGTGVFDGKITRGLKPVYYGCFDKAVKKAACAISIRKNEAAAFEEEFSRKYLNTFGMISACDSAIAERLQAYTDTNVETTASLLMLLETEDYRQLVTQLQPSFIGRRIQKARAKQRKAAPYVLLHTVDGEWTVRKVAEMLIEDTGLSVIHNCTNVAFMKQQGTVAACGPEQVVAYIAEAEYVVTNVAETAVLAARFGKKLLLVAPGPDEQRMIEFAKAAGLEAQLINDKADYAGPKQTEIEIAVVAQRMNNMKETLERSIRSGLENI